MIRFRVISEVRAITFDDFFTLRYPVREREDIIYPILRGLKREGVVVDDKEFLRRYVKNDELYQRKLRETLRESLLDEIVASALTSFGYESRDVIGIVRNAVDFGLATRKARWFPRARRTLIELQKKGYKLGLVSNTHWRMSENSRNEFARYFDVITLSFEHGYAKPHPSIFMTTLNKLNTDANQCLHVGDDPVADIQGAKNVGMKTAFIRRKGAKADADIEITGIADLVTLP